MMRRWPSTLRQTLLATWLALAACQVAAQCADEPAPAAPDGTSPASAAARQQLQQLVQRALARSHAVGNAALLAEAAEQDLRESRAAQSMQASLNANLGPGLERSEGSTTSALLQGSLSVGASQLLWDGGRTERLIGWRTRLADAARLGQISQQQQLALSTVSLALDGSRYRQHEQVYGLYVQKMACLVDALQTIVNADRGRASELLQARKALQQAELSLQGAQSARRQTAIRLQRLVGDDAPGGAALAALGPLDAALPASASLEALLADAERSTEIAQLAAQADAAGVYAQALDAGRRPQLSWTLSGSRSGGFGGTVGGTHGLGLGVGLTLSMPLLNPGLDPAIDAARLRARAAREQREDALESRRARLRETWEQALASADRARRVRSVLGDSEQVRAATFLQWQQLGRRSLFDVMGAESEHYNLRIALADALHDGQQLQALLWSLGRGVDAGLQPP